VVSYAVWIGLARFNSNFNAGSDPSADDIDGFVAAHDEKNVSTTYEITAGWTAPIDIDLLTKGALPSGTMSGMTAAIVLKDRSGNTIDTSGDVTIADSTNWVVRYTPDATDLVPGVYLGRVKVTDSSSQVAYFPSGEADVWIVRPETY